MAFPLGLKPGMSSCAPPYHSTHLSTQTSLLTRPRFASLAGSLKHQPGLCTTQPFAIWLLLMSPCRGEKWMSSSIMIFWRKRPCPTASIAIPMVIAPWVVLLDQSLSSLFIPSHLPQPLPHLTPLAQPPTLPFHPATSSPSHQHLPITMTLLRQIKEELARPPDYLPTDKLMLWLAFTLAFYGFLRSSDFTSPSEGSWSVGCHKHLRTRDVEPATTTFHSWSSIIIV